MFIAMAIEFKLYLPAGKPHHIQIQDVARGIPQSR